MMLCKALLHNQVHQLKDEGEITYLPRRGKGVLEVATFGATVLFLSSPSSALLWLRKYSTFHSGGTLALHSVRFSCALLRWNILVELLILHGQKGACERVVWWRNRLLIKTVKLLLYSYHSPLK